MKQILHTFPSPSHLLPPPPPPSISLPLHLSRRSLAISLPLLFPTLSSSTAIADCTKPTTTATAFLDITIDNDPIGRITIGLYGNSAPRGAARFAALVSGSAGISYRRKEFIKIMPNYIQHAGIRSYGVDAEMAERNGGLSTAAEGLMEEWEAARREECVKNVEGSVGLVVRNPRKAAPNVKVVAKKGRLEVVEEEVGVDPNGTEFVIVGKESPGLDESVLVVGRVVDGMEVVEKIRNVKNVQENTSSPYFRVAKLIGDRRAVVAERGFNRPFSKVLITNCGLIA